MATVDLPASKSSRHPPSANADSKVPHVLAITSGKGGVGKSSISVNLGIALQRMGHKVCLFDADTGLANINILLGLTPRLSLEHVLFGNKSVNDVMLDGPHGLKVIPGANGIVECVRLQARQQAHLTRELASIEGNYDYLLVDTAAGISDETMDFVRAAQQTLLVVTTESTSLTDAFSMVKLLRRRGKKSNYHVVVNMCTNSKQAREIFHRFSGAVEKYIGVKLNYLGFIPQDESLRAAVSMQSPVTLFPESDPSCRNFFRLGQALEDCLDETAPRTSFSAYWQYRYRRHQMRDSASRGPAKNTTAAPRTPAQTRIEQEPLSKLRTRLLTLIAQGDKPAKEFTSLIKELTKAVHRVYPQTRPKPTPPPAQTRQRVSLEPTSSPERIKSPEPISSLEPISNPEPISSPEPIKSPEPEYNPQLPHSPESDTRFPPSARPQQRYDEQRFGTQEELLLRLRRHPDQPLDALLGTSRPRTHDA